ncbi:putative reverse transcriptase zinc-binding domain-containing protein [Helianthus annuus]|nr:putative reverse transcriptase zinc-binding domain-containing protein [Helianthus annuus]
MFKVLVKNASLVSFRIRVEVDWCRIVWFGQCIPRNAFLLWLIMRRKLLTQDKILSWDFSRRKNMNMMCCLLCYANHDSHSHLFFECKFSTQVWLLVRQKAGMGSVHAKWDDIVNWLLDRSNSKLASVYVAKLIVAATAYYIWQERNARLFRNQVRPPESLSEIIIQQVRYKLIGAKLKKCEKVRRLLRAWDIEGSVLHDDGG